MVHRSHGEREVGTSTGDERARTAADAKFQAAFETSRDALSIFTCSEGRFLDVNSAYLRMTEQRREDVIGKTATQLGHWPTAEDRAAFWRRAQPQLEHDGHLRDVPVTLRFSGTLHDCLISAQSLEVDGVRCLVASTADITDREHAKDALRESEALFRTLAETSRAVIALTDGRRFVYVNPRLEELSGYTRAELMGMDSMTLSPPDVRETLADRAGARLRGEDVPSYYESPMLTNGGERRWVETAVTRVEIGGRFLNLIISVDVTDRRQAEQKLRESETRFRALAEKSRAGIIVTEGSRFTYVNPKYVEITGYAESELLGMGASDLVVPESQQMVAERRQARLRGERVPEQYETQLVTKQGERRWIEISATRVVIDERPVILSTIIDITERKRGEQSLRAAEAQLQHAQKMDLVGRLAGSVAHDFNNLLTVVVGHCDLLLRSMEEEDPNRDGLTAIAQAADSGTALTQQLLGLSRRDVIHPRVVDPNETVLQVQQLLPGLIGEHIRFVCDLDAEVAHIRVDPNQLEHVLINLAVNARDAMPDGGELRVATTSTVCDAAFVRAHPGTQPGRYVAVSVSDTGRGMDEATAAQAFEPFYTTKPRDEGTGLGLATVYNIVRRYGGCVTLETALEQGATVTAYFPQAVAADRLPPTPSRAGLLTGTETVLVVEDNAALRELLCRGLQDRGYTVLTACDGPEALELCGEDVPIDLLFTDVIMPGMNGRELMERLTTRAPGLKTLFMSGYTDDILQPLGAREGAPPLLRKPFTLDEAAQQIRQVLNDGKATERALSD